MRIIVYLIVLQIKHLQIIMLLKTIVQVSQVERQPWNLPQAEFLHRRNKVLEQSFEKLISHNTFLQMQSNQLTPIQVVHHVT